MAKTRALKGRIQSVENTRKITRTMEMVRHVEAEARAGPRGGGAAVRAGAGAR